MISTPIKLSPSRPQMILLSSRSSLRGTSGRSDWRNQVLSIRLALFQERHLQARSKVLISKIYWVVSSDAVTDLLSGSDIARRAAKGLGLLRISSIYQSSNLRCWATALSSIDFSSLAIKMYSRHRTGPRALLILRNGGSMILWPPPRVMTGGRVFPTRESPCLSNR